MTKFASKKAKGILWFFIFHEINNWLFSEKIDNEKELNQYL